MDKNSIKINQEMCERVAKIISGLKFKDDFGNRDFITFKAAAETKLRAYLFATAICHQTHTLINRELNLKGWDYLEYVFTRLAKNGSPLIDPESLVNKSLEDVVEELKVAVSFDDDPESCTLDKLEERAKIIIDIAKVLNKDYQNKVSNLIAASEGLLLNNSNGLYELLEKIESFNDPMRKKSTVFIQLVEEGGLLEIKDKNNIIPIMDYHAQRVLLRLGCIEVGDDELGEKLKNREKVDSDQEVREACIDVVRIISEGSGCDYKKMDYFFWSLGRSCCNQKLLCQDKVCNKKPCTLTKVIDLPDHDKCIFQDICKGFVDEKYRKYWQPEVDTDYY